jgi:hypothetical protein
MNIENAYSMFDKVDHPKIQDGKLFTKEEFNQFKETISDCGLLIDDVAEDDYQVVYEDGTIINKKWR